jgi:TonB-linked SusC/RagA family outer membrane protein
MRKITLLLTLLLSATLLATAQSGVITGKVVDEGGTPITGASIMIKGTSAGVAADAKGNFRIDAKPGDVLVISAIGIPSKEATVGSGTSLTVTLARQSQTLSEVVVTAVGITRAKRALGYATTTVKGEELTKARETNIVNSLAGKVAGVRITSQSGTVGGSSKIVIRGVTSIVGGNQPIFVIDGLPVDNSSQQINTISTSSVPQGSAGADFGNRAGDINPDDVESITVLKGAAATALYGARAKNGAIIITTKKGRKGATSISVNSSIRYDNVLKLPHLQNEYAQGNQGTYNLANTNGWGPKISEVQDRKFVNFLGDSVTLKAYPDNVKEFYKTGKTYINSVSFEGGGEGGDYRFGFTNTTQDGIISKQKLERNVISLSAGRNLGKGIDVRTNLNYTRTAGDGRTVQSSNNPNVLQSLILSLPRTVDIHQVETHTIDPVTKQQITLTPSRTGNNPYWIINNNNFSNVVDRFYGNAIISYSPAKWLTVSDNIGTDFYTEFRRGVTRPGTIGALTGNFFTANLYNRLINNDLILTATHDFTKDIGLKVIAGHNVYETYYRRDQSDAQTLYVDQLYNFSNAGSISTTNTSNKRRIVGVYGDIGLSYKNYLFLNVTGRNDWSSTLPVSNRSYFYPSVSSSFVFSEVLPKTNWFNYGKIRASWANVGSGTDPYSLTFTYSPQNAAFAQYGFGTIFPFNGVIGFSAPGIIPNPNLKPQNQVTYEVGAEMRFLNNRANLDVTYYYSNTQDQIVNLSLPNSTGYSAKSINAGSLLNKGVEVTLGLVPVRSKNFTWGLDVNFSANKQTVNLPAEIKSYSVQSGWSGLQIKGETGKSFAIYGTAWQRDSSGNIIIDANTGLRKTILDQRLGNQYPDWIMGINNTVSYKNVSLSFLVDVRKGGVIYSSSVSSLRTAGLAIETAENRGRIFIDKGVIVDASGKSIPNTIPVQSMQDFWSQFNTGNTEANIFDASYAKLREIRISYAIPSRAFSRGNSFIKGLEVGLEGRNLWIIKSYVPHIDPEVNFFGTESLGEAVEFSSVPSTRTIGLNVRIKI